jgi:uncharacterized Ntn-hydrolase superfamily protein
VTYSAIAVDPGARQMGVAVQSHWFAVGAIVPWAEPGVGVLATQANSDLRAGRTGLRQLAESGSAQSTLDHLIATPRAAVSQIAVLSADGQVAAHTGPGCVSEAGHRTGQGWSVQANMMLRTTVPEAMAAALTAGEHLPLGQRLLAALLAAEAEGGDVRGMQSASMLIVSTETAGHGPETIVDVRIDDSADPLAELGRLCQLAEASNEHERGLELLAENPARAAGHWARAAELAPGSEEHAFWLAIALAADGDTARSRRMLASLTSSRAGWKTMLGRVVAAGLLPASDWVREMTA